MPLVSDRKSEPLSHSNSRSIGIWMSVEGRKPLQPVRVLVSYEALSQLDPSNVRDLHGALGNFDRFRSQVETAASRKFDRNGFDAEKYEGMPREYFERYPKGRPATVWVDVWHLRRLDIREQRRPQTFIGALQHLLAFWAIPPLYSVQIGDALREMIDKGTV